MSQRTPLSSAASMRRLSSPRALQRAEDVDLVHDVVKPVLLEPNGARLWYGSQGLRREHCAARESRVQRISRAAKSQACNDSISRRASP